VPALGITQSLPGGRDLNGHAKTPN
jgi:hypothetical protein